MVEVIEGQGAKLLSCTLSLLVSTRSCAFEIGLHVMLSEMAGCWKYMRYLHGNLQWDRECLDIQAHDCIVGLFSDLVPRLITSS